MAPSSPRSTSRLASSSRVFNLTVSNIPGPRMTMYMLGCEVDYVEDLTGSYFRVSNPNATASCGCGNSFAV